jgi:hypothetical protein
MLGARCVSLSAPNNGDAMAATINSSRPKNSNNLFMG